MTFEKKIKYGIYTDDKRKVYNSFKEDYQFIYEPKTKEEKKILFKYWFEEQLKTIKDENYINHLDIFKKWVKIHGKRYPKRNDIIIFNNKIIHIGRYAQRLKANHKSEMKQQILKLFK